MLWCVIPYVEVKRCIKDDTTYVATYVEVKRCMVVWCWRYYSVWCCGMVGGEVGIDVSWGTR